MPKLGDLIKGKSIGKYGTATYIYVKCNICKNDRWVINKPKILSPFSKHCNNCARHLPKLRMDNNGCWKGGRKINAKGYIEIKLPYDSPYLPMANMQRYVREHRLIMAKHIGRLLYPWEIIHHLNGNKSDNRIENLLLLPNQNEHAPDCLLRNYIKRLEKRLSKLKTELGLLRDLK
jgi:hypothetical protein